MSVDKTGGPQPCPFCGKPPETMPSGENGRGLMIECITPNCVNPHTSYYDHASAIAAWNRRAPDPQAAARIAALERALEELADLMDDVVSGNYKPDSFTTQPARDALSGTTPPDGLVEAFRHALMWLDNDANGDGYLKLHMRDDDLEKLRANIIRWKAALTAHRGDKTQAIGAEVSK